MYVDAKLLFSDAQAVTAAAASTSVVDLGAAREIGTGEDLYVVVSVDVAMTDASSDSTLTVDLYADSTESFTPDSKQTLFTIPAVSAAGAVFIAKISPVLGAYRYLELYYTPNNGNLSTGSFTAFIAKDVSSYRAYADGITIS